jgi:hypothetical protein
MASTKHCLLLLALLYTFVIPKAQHIYYPAGASQLLQSSATDMAMLLQKATNQPIQAIAYTQLPSSGYILQYNSTITDNQACLVKKLSNNVIRFSAAEDNGLVFGIYQYLHQLGFKFYQPGTIWEVTPSLSNTIIAIDTVYTCSLKYKSWFISGGHNTWAMDNNQQYNWDVYFGNNGHEWALYQRRNGMLGAYRFAGHRGDIMQGNYLQTLQNNPCYVAPYNGSRVATVQSVPDVNNTNAIKAWGNAIKQQYVGFSNTIQNNIAIYPNIYRNFSYNYQHIGLEVPDGAHWANTIDGAGCGQQQLLCESNQHIILANATASNINSILPNKKFQVYAYDSHANLPSDNLSINNNIDIQVVPTAFQFETSAKGLLNRWYNKNNNVSEYHYLNIPQWSGETPSIYVNELKNTIQRIKQKNSQGIVWEASPAKFASLPYLLAANNFLLRNTAVDNTLQEFCTQMFGTASTPIYQLLQAWGNDDILNVNNGIQDNKYKIPYYLHLLQKADVAANNESSIVKQRLLELKAYLHYMVLYYDWAFDQRQHQYKKNKAAALCVYAATIHHLKIVNSYFLISDIVNKYNVLDSFYVNYNVQNGTVYESGNLPLITATEIQQNYLADLQTIAVQIPNYSFRHTSNIINQFAAQNLQPLDSIGVKINYTQGKDYTQRSEFYIAAPAAGNFTIQYTATWDMPLKGHINFTVEDINQPLSIVADVNINRQTSNQIITINLPAAGTYKLSVATKYKVTVDVSIITKGNYFYKHDAFLGNTIENYRANLKNLPGYIFVPAGINQVYFSLNNSNPGGAGFATPAQINSAFNFVDATNNPLLANLANATDSAFFVLNIPNNNNGTYIKANKMEQYRLCLANISNHYWYAAKKPCPNTNFNFQVIEKANTCAIKATAVYDNNQYTWQVVNNNITTEFNHQSAIELFDVTNNNVRITLKYNDVCSTTTHLSQHAYILNELANCNKKLATDVAKTILLFPNPTAGNVQLSSSQKPTTVQQILLYNSAGNVVAKFNQVQQFSISHLPTGVYFYRLIQDGKVSKGQLVKK